jgi:LytS/YehU family sensor histidine kinase
MVKIVVEDNGPGFENRADHRPRGGYGLSNIRQRLAGHFDASAALSIHRDADRAITIAAVELPFLREEPRPAAATTDEARR